MNPELIKTFRKFGCTLRIWDTGHTDYYGKAILQYQLKSSKRIIFEGSDFRCPPLHAIDSLECVAALLGFLTMKPWDTCREYFQGYTQEQLDWCQSDKAEQLAMWVYDHQARQYDREARQGRKRRNTA